MVHFCIAVQTRQLLANIVGQELDFGGGDRCGVMHAVLEPVERGALGVVAHDRLRPRCLAEGNAARWRARSRSRLDFASSSFCSSFTSAPFSVSTCAF